MTFLWDCTIKTSLILILALLGTMFFRKQSAALRHRILSVAVFSAVITHGLALVVPAWSWTFRPPIAIEPSVPVSVSIPQVYVATTSLPVRPVRSAFPAYFPEAIWLLGASISLAAVIIGSLRLGLVASSSKIAADAKWGPLAEAISQQYGLRRSVRLLRGQNSAMLATWGVMRPKILLPVGSEDWTTDRIRAVLCHELAHVRRFDWLVQIAAEMLRVLYWFNPVVWIICGQLRLEAEYACDDAVLDQGFAGSAYAAELLEIVRAQHQRDIAWSAALMMARRSTVEKRFAAILNHGRNRRPAGSSATFAIIAIALSITVPIASFGSSRKLERILQTPRTGSIKGSIYKDERGKVSGALVIASTEDGRAQKAAKTNAEGAFIFTGLPAGSYVLQGCTEEFGPSAVANVELKAGMDVTQDLKIDGPFVKTAEPACDPHAIHLQPSVVTAGVSSLGSRPPHQYTGELISIDMKADIRDFIQYITAISGFEIDLDPFVERNVTVHFKDVPLDLGLDVVLNNSGLNTEVRGGRVLLISRGPQLDPNHIPLGTVTIEGKITDVRFQNPRTLLQVRAPNADGATQIWPVEWASTDYLAGIGLQPNTLKIGDQVIVTGNVTPPNTIHLIVVKRPSDGFSWGDVNAFSSAPSDAVMFVSSSSR